MPADGQCPACGVYFLKWEKAQEAQELVEAEESPLLPAVMGVDASELPRAIFTSLLTPQARMSSTVFYARCAALLFLAIWGFRLMAMDYSDGEIGGSFMHNILLPIHEAGHVFFMPFGEFLTILGGSFFQVALPLGIGIAFAVKNRDNFAAAICLWWVGVSFLDLAPYVYDALNPQLMLLGGHTGEDGPHDWIYLLERFGQLKRSPAWGFAVHKLGVLIALGSMVWAGVLLWRQREQLDEGRME